MNEWNDGQSTAQSEPNELSRTWVKRPASPPPPSAQRTILRMLWGLFPLWMLLFLLSQIHPRYQPWLIPGAAPEPRATADAPFEMVGTWRGQFGVGLRPALLAITNQNGNRFGGVLVSRDHGSYKVQIEGAILADNSVIIRETSTVSSPFLGAWALGTDTGALTETGLWMAGVGRDTADQRYGWTLTHVSTTPYIPRD